MTPVERLDQIKAKFASYGRTIGHGERAEFNTLIDELRKALVVAPPPPPPPPPLPPPQNLPPVVIAGPDQTIVLPAVLTLGGSVIDDGQPTGGVVTKVWSKTSGPGQVTFTMTTASFSAPGTYVLRLTASDLLVSAFDELTVTVQLVAPPPPPPPPTTGGKPVLQPSDFVYLGYYDIQTNSTDTPYASGLTHRYVGGDLRFLNVQHKVGLHELSLAGRAYGSLITSPTRVWSNIGGLMNYRSLWWDDAKQRLWTTTAIDYTPNVIPTQVFTRTLNDDGTISNLHGPVSLEGISAKRAYGGALAVPTWFQQQYGVGPYAIGWGGYTSLVDSGGKASMGPTMFIMPDPAGFANNAVIPVGQFKTIMDNGPTGAKGDWYASGAPTSYDRGSRLTHPINYFDGGDPRQNPQTPPTGPPATGAQWLSPAPDGKGRFVWGDSYFNTGCWIDGVNKHGYIAVASLSKGKCYYMSSDLHKDFIQFELHIWNPADLGAAAKGTKPTWNVKPSSMVELTLPGAGAAVNTSAAPISEVGGATYDPVTKRLYLIYFGGDPPGGPLQYKNRLYVYQVNS